MPRTLKRVLPLLDEEPALAAVLEPYGVAPDDPVERLLERNHAPREILERLGGAAAELRPLDPIVQLIPGIGPGGRRHLPFNRLDTRSGNALKFRALTTWEDLGQLTPRDILDLENVGPLSVARILGMALEEVARDRIQEAPEPESPAEEGGGREPAAVVLEGVRRLAQWARYTGSAATVGEALDLAARRENEWDLPAGFLELRGLPLAPIAGSEPDAAAAFRELWSGLKGHERFVFSQRLRLDPPSFAAIGRELGLSGTRVYQYGQRAELRLKHMLQTGAAELVRWRAAALSRRLGTAIRLASETAQAALADATRGLPEEERADAEALLLWLAGPYELDRKSGWIRVQGSRDIGPPPPRKLMRGIDVAYGGRDRSRLMRAAEDMGLVREAAVEWVELCRGRR